ncbi:hypothetical protein I4U23_021092 [Adineta vaga]|nr:hypothetical protein I4U23_021092 [Adineta vaga]
MMEKSMYMITFILLMYLQSILGFDRFYEISPIYPNISGYVWIDDTIEIEAIDIGAEKWLFNTSVLFTNTGVWTSENSSIASQINATINFIAIDRSRLVLNRVQRFHSGNYAVDEEPGIYSLNLTVYDAKLFSVESVLRNDSNMCKAFLLINDSIEPTDLGISRIANSSDLTFDTPKSSNFMAFEILNSNMDILNTSMSIDIDIKYTLNINNYTIVLSKNISLGELINEPNISTTGFSNNCTVHIEHKYMRNIECIRNITYWLKTNDTIFYYDTFNNLDSQELDYTWNLTSIDLVIEYDIIYGKYIFNMQVLKCAPYVTPDTTFTTEESSYSQFTTSVSYTNEDSTSKDIATYSASTYYATSTNYSEYSNSSLPTTSTIILAIYSFDFLFTINYQNFSYDY